MFCCAWKRVFSREARQTALFIQVPPVVRLRSGLFQSAKTLVIPVLASNPQRQSPAFQILKWMQSQQSKSGYSKEDHTRAKCTHCHLQLLGTYPAILTRPFHLGPSHRRHLRSHPWPLCHRRIEQAENINPRAQTGTEEDLHSKSWGK